MSSAPARCGESYLHMCASRRQNINRAFTPLYTGPLLKQTGDVSEGWGEAHRCCWGWCVFPEAALLFQDGMIKNHIPLLHLETVNNVIPFSELPRRPTKPAREVTSRLVFSQYPFLLDPSLPWPLIPTACLWNSSMLLSVSAPAFWRFPPVSKNPFMIDDLRAGTIH